MQKRQRGRVVLVAVILVVFGPIGGLPQVALAQQGQRADHVPVRSVTPVGVSLDGAAIGPAQMPPVAGQTVTRSDISPIYDPFTVGARGVVSPRSRLRFRLIWWPARSDVDLHVIEPGGHHIWYRDKSSPAGGKLDRDDRTSGGAENITWPTGQAPAGTYRFYAVYYRGKGPRKVGLEVLLDGRQVWSRALTLQERGDRTPVFQFALRPERLGDALRRYHRAGWDNVGRNGRLIIDTAEGVGFVASDAAAGVGAAAGTVVYPGAGTAAGYVIGHQAPESVAGVALTGASYTGGIAREAARDVSSAARRWIRRRTEPDQSSPVGGDLEGAVDAATCLGAGGIPQISLLDDVSASNTTRILIR